MSTDAGVHRRFDPLSGEWVMVSPHRGKRPWQGQVDEPAPARAQFDAACYLCPGNERAGGEHNPDYADLFVFGNDFPALLPAGLVAVNPVPAGSTPGESAPEASVPEAAAAEDLSIEDLLDAKQVAGDEAAASGDRADVPSLLRSAAVAGECRVVCFSPRHDLSLGELDQAARRRVVDAWAEQVRELGERWAWVQCFENRGAMMGCSSPHPHGQIWAMDEVPTLVAREAELQQAHMAARGTSLLADVLAEELAYGERIVVENAHWVALVPFWARWPFETLLLPRRGVPCLVGLDGQERDALSAILGDLMCAYDNLFACDFPYSFGWHGAPSNAQPALRDAWHLHAHCYPPLLRSASVRKFMVGFELLAEAQRDLTAEDAAQRLRAACGPHWRRS